MKKKVKELIKHPLIYGSSIVVFGSLAANFFNFLFNVFMSRSLSVADYGVLASVISLISFPVLISNALTPMIVRFAGDYFASDNFALIRGLYIKIVKALFLFCLVVFIAYFASLQQLSAFFHITDYTILIMTGFLVIISIVMVLNMSFLQAKLAFGFQVAISMATAVSKVVFGAIFVLLGYSVTGAVGAIFIGGIVGYVFSFYPLRFLFNKTISKPTIETKEFFSYGIPSALTFLGLTSFISSDIMLVKHLFDPVQAGLYAGLSLVGRVIFYISFPIGTVMFPVIVRKINKKENFTNTFKLALLLVTIPCVFLTAFYFMFPEFVLLFFLKKQEYLTVSPYVGWVGAFMSCYSLLMILANFYLSIKKTLVYIPILLGAIAQIVLIFLFHESFIDVLFISLGTTFVLVCILLLYYPYATKK